MKKTATTHIKLPSKKLLKILLKTLQPETTESPTTRSKISINGKDKMLVIKIKALDTSALRSTLNSYLRWVALVKDTYKLIAGLEQCENT